MTTPTAPAPAQKAHPQLQAVKNLQLLARQALGNRFETMSVDPKMIADACLAFDAALSGATDDERVRVLSTKLSAAEANVESLGSQIEARYQDGVKDGSAKIDAYSDLVGAEAVRIARATPNISETAAVADAKTKLNAAVR